MIDLLLGYVGIFIGYMLLVFIPLIIYIIYRFYSERKNSLSNKVILEDKNKEVKNFNVRVDYKNRRITYFCHNCDMEKEDYTFDEIASMIKDKNKIKEWNEWIDSIINSDKHEIDFFLTLKKGAGFAPILSKLTYSLIDKDKGVIYLKGFNIKQGDLIKSNIIAINSSPAFSFRARIKSQIEKIGNRDGIIMIINFNLYDLIKRRYSQNEVKTYLATLWGFFENYDGRNDIVAGIYRYDNVVIYNPHLYHKKEISEYVESLLESIGDTIAFDNFHFEIKPCVGFTKLGEFTDNIEIALKQAYKVALIAREQNLRIFAYDIELDNNEKDNLKLVARLKDMLDNNLLVNKYTPVISLSNGKEIGYFAEIDFKETKIKSFSNALKIAQENGFENEFFDVALDSWFSNFVFKQDYSNNRLFVFCDSDLLNEFTSVYLSKEEYKRVSLILVITDYEELIYDHESIETIEKISNSGIRLGITASEIMQTTVHQILRKIDYLVWPVKLTKNILKDEKNKLVVNNIIESLNNYNLISVAWNIANYQQAEYLKNIGVMNMSGLLFEKGNSVASEIYSIRRLNKLIG